MSNTIKLQQLIDASLERFLSRPVSEGPRPVTNTLAIPEKVFEKLHQDFAAGAKTLLIGKKDGSNRKVVLHSDGSIRDATTESELYPLEGLMKKMQSRGHTPLVGSDYALAKQRMMEEVGHANVGLQSSWETDRMARWISEGCFG